MNMSDRILCVVSLLCAFLVVGSCDRPTLILETQVNRPGDWRLRCQSSETSSQITFITVSADDPNGTPIEAEQNEVYLSLTPETEVIASCRVGDETSNPVLLAGEMPA